MSAAVKRYVQAIWIGIAIQIAGRILDGRWHATHDEFEGASQQLEAHWLLWLGVAVTLVVSGLALARLGAGKHNLGFTLLFASGVFYSAISVWHFIEHANHNDPELAHVLLGVTQAAMIIGALIASLGARGQQRPMPA